MAPVPCKYCGAVLPLAVRLHPDPVSGLDYVCADCSVRMPELDEG